MRRVHVRHRRRPRRRALAGDDQPRPRPRRERASGSPSCCRGAGPSARRPAAAAARARVSRPAAFQVAGQQDRVARVPHEQHQAADVLVAGGPVGGGCSTSSVTSPAVKPVAGRDDSASARRPARAPPASRARRASACRRTSASASLRPTAKRSSRAGRPLKWSRSACESEHLVDAADAAVPQVRGDDRRRHVRAGQRAGVVEKRAAVGRLDDDAAAVADGQERQSQLVGRRPQRPAGQPDRQPREAGQTDPSDAAPHLWQNQHCNQANVNRPAATSWAGRRRTCVQTAAVGGVNDPRARREAILSRRRQRRSQPRCSGSGEQEQRTRQRERLMSVAPPAGQSAIRRERSNGNVQQQRHHGQPEHQRDGIAHENDPADPPQAALPRRPTLLDELVERVEIVGG